MTVPTTEWQHFFYLINQLIFCFFSVAGKLISRIALLVFFSNVLFYSAKRKTKLKTSCTIKLSFGKRKWKSSSIYHRQCRIMVIKPLPLFNTSVSFQFTIINYEASDLVILTKDFVIAVQYSTSLLLEYLWLLLSQNRVSMALFKNAFIPYKKHQSFSATLTSPCEKCLQGDGCRGRQNSSLLFRQHSLILIS